MLDHRIIIATVFLSHLSWIGMVAGEQQCHVCVSPGSAAEVQQTFPGVSLASCHLSSDLRTCPPQYKGCLTQTGPPGAGGGGRVEKTLTCALLSIDVCRVANGVEYCYCSGQSCNAPQSQQPLATTSDDEDLLAEGSGGSEPEPQPTITTTPAVKTHTLSSASTLHSACQLLVMLALLLLVCR